MDGGTFYYYKYNYEFINLKIMNTIKNNVNILLCNKKKFPGNFLKSNITKKTFLLTGTRKYNVSNSTNACTNYCFLKNSWNHWEMKVFIYFGNV